MHGNLYQLRIQLRVLLQRVLGLFDLSLLSRPRDLDVERPSDVAENGFECEFADCEAAGVAASNNTARG